MKPETLIYDKLKVIIPNKSDKTTFFVSITKTSYEAFFYVFMEGRTIQCYELAEEENLDENKFDSVFASIVDIIKKLKLFRTDKNNIVTITVDKTGVKMDMKYYGNDVHLYKIKKEWILNNIMDIR